MFYFPDEHNIAKKYSKRQHPYLGFKRIWEKKLMVDLLAVHLKSDHEISGLVPYILFKGWDEK